MKQAALRPSMQIIDQLYNWIRKINGLSMIDCKTRILVKIMDKLTDMLGTFQNNLMLVVLVKLKEDKHELTIISRYYFSCQLFFNSFRAESALITIGVQSIGILRSTCILKLY